MREPIDEYYVRQLQEFDGKSLVSVTKEGLELPEDEEEKKKMEESKAKFENICKFTKEILDKIEKVTISNRLIFTLLHCDQHLQLDSQYGVDHESPGTLGQLHHGIYDGQKAPGDQPRPPHCETPSQKAETDKNDKAVKDMVVLPFETALLTSGFSLEDPLTYSNHIHCMIKLGLVSMKMKWQQRNPVLRFLMRFPTPEGDEDASRMEEVD
ncbi:hypothetical protein P7K49_006145 [Saguinus oedipus]|uniref:Uncharacterized protein n=1 Tax=Saguinus oedipus TaxID=9490 RepID=A0ABQ9W1K7_SAGOE|nr:hypothetical protein P7K49_006145 [Saguinus oedipus]